MRGMYDVENRVGRERNGGDIFETGKKGGWCKDF